MGLGDVCHLYSSLREDMLNSICGSNKYSAELEFQIVLTGVVPKVLDRSPAKADLLFTFIYTCMFMSM